MSAVLDLACELIRRCSVTPVDAGCQLLLSEKLARMGFRIEHRPHGQVDNLWAVHGDDGPTLVFLGHTDVVPSGPVSLWSYPPFEPTIDEGFLYGRGAADMKGSVAAMIVAMERFIVKHPDHSGRLALLLTSDEEGPTNLDGVRRVAADFHARGERIDWCVVGEPSARTQLGDLIRVGRRGSLSGTLTVHGVQGHVAYPAQACNPIHVFAPALNELVTCCWDEGNTDFPPTSFQVSNVNAGTGATNVIPGELIARINFRYGTASCAQDLRAQTETILHRHRVNFTLDWNLSGEPYLTLPSGRLRQVVSGVCRDLCDLEPEQSTAGGISDGRFIALLGAEVLELGPVNATIHKLDECVAIADLDRLSMLYQAICERMLVLGLAG